MMASRYRRTASARLTFTPIRTLAGPGRGGDDGAVTALSTALSEELAADARGVTADPSTEQIFPVYGRNAWKSRLRAQPDVAAAHGYVG
jgi:hypothetical protein